jgi:cholesterol transport system auxiliary component
MTNRKGERQCKALLALAFLLLCAGLSAGCGAARPAHYYELTVPREKETDPPGPTYPVSLLMGPIRASHLYREDRIVYGTSSEHMGTYEYERWAEPPTEMLEEVLLRELRASGRFREVHGQHSNLSGDYLLHGRLFDFKELTGPPLQARLTIGLELRDVKTGATVWEHFYSHDEPVEHKNISAMVATLNQNVQRAVAECQASLEQYFASHPPAASAPPQ